MLEAQFETKIKTVKITLKKSGIELTLYLYYEKDPSFLKQLKKKQYFLILTNVVRGKSNEC